MEVTMLTSSHEPLLQPQHLYSSTLEDAAAACCLPLQPLSCSLGPHAYEAACFITDRNTATLS